jgi:transposase
MPLKEDYEFKIKSRIDVREISVTMQDGSKKKYLVDEKQVVFWSKKYDDKAKAERTLIIKKAEEIIQNPSKYKKKSFKGTEVYLKNVTFDKDTGEVIDNPGLALQLDLEKIKEDELLDGYYCIITSELDMPDSKIIDTYRGLSDIEDNFKVSKSNLRIRPVYVSGEDSINAHVLTCFIALVIIRLIQKQTHYKFSPQQIEECLNRIGCVLETENIFLLSHRSVISDVLGETFGIDFSKRRLLRKDITTLMGDVKK